jgi:DNA-binding SARP family transcriptional activator
MEFRALGPLVVVDRGRHISVDPMRVRVVLAILLLRANTLVGLEDLIDELWPERPPRNARTMVHTYVSRLRAALCPKADSAGAGRLVTRRPGYELRVTVGEFDLDRFAGLVSTGRAGLRDGMPAEGAGLLRRAHALWRGRPFADVPATPAIAAEAARLTEVRLATLEERFHAELMNGREASVVAELTQLASAYPLRERIVGQLMFALQRSGRAVDALALYRLTWDRFATELGIEPGDTLQQLHLAILRGSVSPV